MNELFLYRHMMVPLNMAPAPILIVLFFFSVVLHEVAHGYTALKCGDPTAQLSGRLTLNPLPHVDVLGTIIVPLLMYTMGGFVIGWAKPVPVNPYNFKNLREGTLKVGASGPLTNFILAVIFAVVVWIFNILNLPSTNFGLTMTALFAGGVTVNLILGLFNLVPVPPLDGSRIVSTLLPPEAAEKYERIEPYGILIVFLLLSLIWPLIIGIGNLIYRVLFWGLPL